VPAYWLAATPGPALLAGLGIENIIKLSNRNQSIWGNQAPVRKFIPLFFSLVAIGIAAGSVTWLISYKKAMKSGDLKYQVYPSFADERLAIAFVSRSSARQKAWLSQELRDYDSGLDYNLLYLLSLEEGNALRLRPENQPGPEATHYIYHNLANPWLASNPKAQKYATGKLKTFGLASIISIPPSQ
jgi:hypothetical protein